MIGQVRITFCPIFRINKTSFHQGLSFSISVLILICTKIRLSLAAVCPSDIARIVRFFTVILDFLES